VAGPAIWNWLPDSLSDPAISRDSFKRSLNTFCYCQLTRVHSALELFGRCALQIYLLTYLHTHIANDILSKCTQHVRERSPMFSEKIHTLVDHASRDNHMINWSQATILDKESDRWIKEACTFQKEGRSSMNQNEGSYTLSHTYDRFLATSHHYRGKNWKKN